MKAIETHYKGYRFRSRLEARWAVFFDALDLKWEYEKEGFDFGCTRYLPDFWLPALNRWVEIKGVCPTEDEIRKCVLLAEGSGFDVLLGWMPPGEYEEGQMLSVSADLPDSDWVNISGFWWYACKACGYVGCSFEAKYSVCNCADWSGTHNQGRNGWVYDGDRLEAAYNASRSARFEFGESGN